VAYVSDNSSQCWFWWAMVHKAGVSLGIVLVHGSTCVLMSCAVCLLPFASVLFIVMRLLLIKFISLKVL